MTSNMSQNQVGKKEGLADWLQNPALILSYLIFKKISRTLIYSNSNKFVQFLKKKNYNMYHSNFIPFRALYK